MINDKLRNRLKLVLYERVTCLLPERIRGAVASSRLLQPLRDSFLRPAGKPAMAQGEVEFEGLQFAFTAPYRTWLKAKRSGIECRICRMIMAQCSAGSICLDVGANYGFITTIMGLTVVPSGRVFSFEPVADIFDIVRKNIADNWLEHCCQLIPAAVGAKDGRMAPIDGIGIVPTVSIDATVARARLQRVDLIKIDVDGADFNVLRGSEETLKRFHPIVIVEMQEDQERIYDFLEEVGYSWLADMQGHAVVRGKWPANIIAAVRPFSVPVRGTLAAARGR